METINNLTKRKKRKTRKRLDELRKRSRRNTSGNCIEKSSQQLSKVCIMGCKSNSNHLITSNRLTLQATFPKAIRSETITRPALAEIKQKKNINLVDFVRDKVSHNCIPAIKEDITRGSIINDFDNTVCLSDYKQSPDCKNNICNTQNHDENSPDCFAFIASPTNQPLEVSKTPIHEDTSIVTSPSQSLQDESGNCLYEEFMNEMCSHFRELTPAIIVDDVIKNTYSNLKRIYIENCEKEYEKNILNCISGRSSDKKKCSEKNTIVQNPMDYIRVEHARKQNTLRVLKQHAIFSGSSSSSSMQSPATPLLASQTPRANKLDVVLYDTPEYNYYPHKLN